MKKSCSDLQKLLKEYVNDSCNHENCTYNDDMNYKELNTECSCGLYNIIDKFIDWIKYREIHTLK